MRERRTARRYELSLPVFIHVPKEKDTPFRKGKTRDMSARGVYFTIEKDLDENTDLDLMVTIPAKLTGNAEVFIRAIGKVVRIEKRSEKGSSRVDVAAVIERYDIVRNEEAETTPVSTGRGTY